MVNPIGRWCSDRIMTVRLKRTVPRAHLNRHLCLDNGSHVGYRKRVSGRDLTVIQQVWSAPVHIPIDNQLVLFPPSSSRAGGTEWVNHSVPPGIMAIWTANLAVVSVGQFVKAGDLRDQSWICLKPNRHLHLPPFYGTFWPTIISI